MKQVLNTQQVTDNLQKLFPGKDIKCTEVANSWDGAKFYIESNTTKVFITGRMVWVKPSLQSWGRYCAYCNQFGKMYQKIRTKQGTMIPFTISTRAKDKQRHEEIDLLLIACGIKAAKKEETDLNRLQKLSAKDYVNFYKLIKEVEVIEANLENKETFDRWGEPIGHQLTLSVKHTKGQFSFPMECITGNQDQDIEIQNIFLNLLGKPVTSKVSELMAA